VASGFAVVTDRFLCLVSADASAETVSALHRALDSDAASIDDGLAVVSGSRTVQRFALAEFIDGPERIALVAVHGDIVVDLDGAASSRFTWPDGAAWITGEARGVTTLRLSLATAPSGAAYLPLRNGAVAASAVAMEASLDRERDALAPAPSPARALGATPAAAVIPEAVHGPSLERQPRRIDLADLMSSKTWTLTLPDGNELVAAPQIVVGRRPWRSNPDETSTYYILVPSPHRQVSGKHVEFAVVGGELHARDLDSTNGTLVLTPDKPPRLLHSGHAVNLGVGDTLDLGEGFRIVVGTRT
jgi:hypothetical protein